MTCPFCNNVLFNFDWNDASCYVKNSHQYSSLPYTEIFEIYFKNSERINSTIQLTIDYLSRDTKIELNYFGTKIIISDLKIGEYLKKNIIAFNFNNLKKIVALT